MENRKNWSWSLVFLIIILGLSAIYSGSTLEASPNWNLKDLFFWPFIPLLIANSFLMAPVIRRKIGGVVLIFVLSVTHTSVLGRSLNSWSVGLSILGSLILVAIIAERSWSFRRKICLVLVPPLISCFSQVLWSPKSFLEKVKERETILEGK